MTSTFFQRSLVPALSVFAFSLVAAPSPRRLAPHELTGDASLGAVAASRVADLIKQLGFAEPLKPEPAKLTRGVTHSSC
jgi:hypothetical protein